MTNNKQRFLNMGGQIFSKNESKHLPAVYQDRFYSSMYLLAEISQLRDIEPVKMLPPKFLFPVQRWKLWTNKLTLNICNWITEFFLSFFRLQGDVVRLWCCMRAGSNQPLQGRVCLQESGMSLFSGTCLWLGFIYLLQWVRARKSPVQRTATHQSPTPGSLL